MTYFECGPINHTTATGLRVLKDISFKLTSPIVMVINGPSGCGKTTLLRAVVGLNKAMVQTRRLDQEIYSERSLPSWRAHVTLLLQDAPCLQGTILHNLTFPFEFKNGGHKNLSKDRIRKIMKKVNLEHIPLDADVSRLSGGERHRLGIVRGLLWAPRVLLADEPLSGLEPELADKCFDLLVDFAREKDAIVICVLHQERFARQADKWLKLENGTLHRINPL